MAGYQRPNQGQNSGQQGGNRGAMQQAKPAGTAQTNKPMGGFQGNKPAASNGGGQTSAGQQGAQPQTKSKNKPKYRLAIVVDVGDGKMQTVKGEDGKTVYVGAAWENKFDGLNIKIEGDIAAGSVVRAYPVEDKLQS